MTQLNPQKKLAGLLVPVFAMRQADDFGIGDTIAVREAIDFCALHQFAMLQILPILETVGDYSPYNPISSRALSPALLALTPSEVPGLKKATVKEAAPESWVAQLRAGNVKYNSVQPLKLQILLAAHHDFCTEKEANASLNQEFEEFKQREQTWLPAYTLFRILIREYDGNPNWGEWRPDHKTLAGAEAWLAKHPDRELLTQTREGFAYIQWVAWRQWKTGRKRYAELVRRGVHEELAAQTARHTA